MNVTSCNDFLKTFINYRSSKKDVETAFHLETLWPTCPSPEWISKGIIYNQLKSLLCLYKYPMDWSHCHWNIIFPGILRRFGGWLLRNRACLIVSQNHTLQHFFFIPKIECDGFGAISNDLRSLTFFEIPHIFWDPSQFLRSLTVFEIPHSFWDPSHF